MKKTKIYNFEIRYYFPEFNQENFHRIRKHQNNPFVIEKIKSALTNKTLGEIDFPVYSRESRENKTKSYWSMSGEVSSGHLIEVVKSISEYAEKHISAYVKKITSEYPGKNILEYLGEGKLGYLKLSRTKDFSKDKLAKIENLVNELEWNGRNLLFRDFSKDEEKTISENTMLYKLFDEAINKNSKQKNH